MEVQQFPPSSPTDWHHWQVYRHPARAACEQSSLVKLHLNILAKRRTDTASAAFEVSAAELAMSDLQWHACGQEHRR
ncbi:hypothetical protein GCM10010124_35600 [Pilimelia terevasa]|uniref:Uncharacterized protein n=1 Tax=Pilimelia terevasa TaxID=53372 RepID=A0A8J3BT92_9ACTN|nr:hypothetical protein [Pilimelia terevasa]GGK39834.1 hypothetical protein GCM10010124_35600 [Pilimelia terevasa]